MTTIYIVMGERSGQIQNGEELVSAHSTLELAKIKVEALDKQLDEDWDRYRSAMMAWSADRDLFYPSEPAFCGFNIASIDVDQES